MRREKDFLTLSYEIELRERWPVASLLDRSIWLQSTRTMEARLFTTYDNKYTWTIS